MIPALATTAAPLVVENLVTEIRETILAARRRRSAPSPDATRPLPYELEAAFDVTLALLIRHRLPLDAPRARTVVAEVFDHDTDLWAAGCAEHIMAIAAESQRFMAAHR